MKFRHGRRKLRKQRYEYFHYGYKGKLRFEVYSYFSSGVFYFTARSQEGRFYSSLWKPVTFLSLEAIATYIEDNLDYIKDSLR